MKTDVTVFIAASSPGAPPDLDSSGEGPNDDDSEVEENEEVRSVSVVIDLFWIQTSGSFNLYEAYLCIGLVF